MLYLLTLKRNKCVVDGINWLDTTKSRAKFAENQWAIIKKIMQVICRLKTSSSHIVVGSAMQFYVFSAP